MPAFKKILIANRGEIACRIARTAKAMGYQTVAIYSDADADARHTSVCDEAVRIGPAAAKDSYLNIEAILSAALRTGADAVHPGYGFLSENAAFAAACVAANLVFIGPSADAIAAMGNKAAAKRRMIAAGVPCVPGYQGDDQSDATLVREASRIGVPLMVKAAAGGGGRGMRLVSSLEDLASALTGARTEAEAAFGSGELILEKAVVDARHVEVQIFGDNHGAVIHLGERDCSIQRRHQKVIEEAPSPAVDATLRAAMGAAAVTAATSIGYSGAGTVEFLLGADGQYYFLEMNTRLQVEHPVTEAITGIDLVAWQLQIARGEALPLAQTDVRLNGHALEVRLYAEDPANDFLPQSGPIHFWNPPHGPGVRVDDGLNTSDRVSTHYDPMLAKIIAHGPTRDAARLRLLAALEATDVIGTKTNQSFLAAMLRYPAFVAGAATTAFIGQYFGPGCAARQPPVPSKQTRAIAAVLLLQASGEMPTGALAGWSSTGDAAYPVLLDTGQATAERIVVIPGTSGSFEVHDGANQTRVTVGHPPLRQSQPPHERRISVDGHTSGIRVALYSQTLYLVVDGVNFEFHDRLRDAKPSTNRGDTKRLVAPMNGRVISVMAKAGDPVVKGQCIFVLEAMKMQHEITAGQAGILSRVLVADGQQVATWALLAEVA
jgi:geranyl-CoA carboxylase alpha subunit